MAEFYPAFFSIAIMAVSIVTLVYVVGYIVTTPYVIIPLIGLIALLTWRRYKRRRV